jgi:hypothetical protein
MLFLSWHARSKGTEGVLQKSENLCSYWRFLTEIEKCEMVIAVLLLAASWCTLRVLFDVY